MAERAKGARQPVAPAGQTRVINTVSAEEGDGASEHQVQLTRTVVTSDEVFFPGTVHARDEDHAASIEEAHQRAIEGEAEPTVDYSARGGAGFGRGKNYEPDGEQELSDADADASDGQSDE